MIQPKTPESQKSEHKIYLNRHPQKPGFLFSFSRAVCILEESAQNQTAFLDKIAVDSDLEDVDASIGEKIKEVKNVLKDRGAVFSSLQKEMELHLLNQREKLNEAAARVWELTCANAKAKEDYNLATKQLAKGGLQRNVFLEVCLSNRVSAREYTSGTKAAGCISAHQIFVGRKNKGFERMA